MEVMLTFLEFVPLPLDEAEVVLLIAVNEADGCVSYESLVD